MRKTNEGAADSFVLRHYEHLVRLTRRYSRENVALVVVIDGDRIGLAKRLALLDEQLRRAGCEPRGPDERIAVLVPTRHVETWIHWLCGDTGVDETIDCKGDPQRSRRRETGQVDARRAAHEWFVTSDEGKAEEQRRLPALAAARDELSRLARL